MSGYHRLLTTLKNVSKEDEEEEEEDSVMDETEMNLEDGNSDISEEEQVAAKSADMQRSVALPADPEGKDGHGPPGTSEESPEEFQFSSVQFSRSVMSDSLQPHGLQHAGPPCPSPTPRVHSNSCPLVSVAIQPSQPLLFLSPPAPNPSQHQSLFQ